MKLIKRNNPNAGYETEDVISVMLDSYVPAGAILNSDSFIVTSTPNLTELEVTKLKMQDMQINQISGAGQLPTFRSAFTGEGNLKIGHRRKYQYNNGIVLKNNAQSNT